MQVAELLLHSMYVMYVGVKFSVMCIHINMTSMFVPIIKKKVRDATVYIYIHAEASFRGGVLPPPPIPGP